MRFPSNLQKKRQSLGVSQVKFAEDLGLTRSMVASYEQGVAEPTLCNLVKMANYLNVTVDELIKK